MSATHKKHDGPCDHGPETKGKSSAEFQPPRGDQPCPCGTGQKFAACCEPILKRQKPAENAEQLMRSRFTAHVARDWEHLHRSYAKTANEPYAPEGEVEGRNWTRLVIHSHEPGVKPDTAFVDFTAYYKEGDAEHPMPEKAEFHRIGGAWLYARAVREGPAPIKSAQAKVGRNDPCPCGSGKKYKQCCLK
jgi:SEC-C motif-containing protein